MNFIKRLIFAIHSVFHSTQMGWVTIFLALFYFCVAQDLFWNGNEKWTQPSYAILFNIPLFAYIADIVVVFVYNFMKKKVEQRTTELSKKLEEATTDASASKEESGKEEAEKNNETESAEQH